MKTNKSQIDRKTFVTANFLPFLGSTTTIYGCLNSSVGFYSFFFRKNFLHASVAHLRICISNHLYYILDGFQFLSKPNHMFYTQVVNSLLQDTLCTFNVEVCSSSLSIQSVSRFFESAGWLEREISEFSGILFVGNSDSRRLLLDYIDDKGVKSTHNSTWEDFSGAYSELLLPTWVWCSLSNLD